MPAVRFCDLAFGNRDMSIQHVPETASDIGPAIWPPARYSSFELQNGDRMSREEFHRLYEQTPDGFKAELIGGVVYVASPLHPNHGKPHLQLGSLLAAYESATPGTDASDNTTIALGDEGEPQPDLYLRVLPEYGGQSATTRDGYVEGAPELIIEVAHSSRAIDLFAKKDDYSRYGVREYLVASVKEQKLRWFDLSAGNEMQPDAAGVYRVRTFPGLWIDGPALWKRDHSQLMRTLQEGLATPEHAALVQELAKRKKP
jgi:Uma2 family endonuclease